MIYLSKDRTSGFESDADNLGIIRTFGRPYDMVCDPEDLAETEELEAAELTQEEIEELPWSDFDLEGLRKTSGMNQKEFADYFDIPVRTLQEWEQGRRTPPAYIRKMMVRIWNHEHAD